MLKVIIPISVLLLIVLCKKLPYIGGKLNVALITAGALTLLLGGLFNPADWVSAWIDGLNRLSWIIALSIFGSLFAEISMRLGTVDTIIGALTAKFGNHPRMLIVCILFALTVAGSLLGDAVAAATVIGMLTIGILASMNLSPEKISGIIVIGASIGSIMPPMTQAMALSSSLVGADPDSVLNIGYITISIIFIVISLYCACFLVKKENVPGANRDVEIKFINRTASEILRENWKSLLPLLFLIVIVLLRTVDIPYLSVDIGPAILQNLNFITLPDGTMISLYEWLQNISILNGLTNGIVLAIICAIIVSFAFPAIHKNAKVIIHESLDKVKLTVKLQICCAFMLGSFYAAGSIDAVSEFAQSLDGNVLKIGGAIALILMGMLTGSQSTSQNIIFSFFGPALVASGITPVYAAVAGSHLASAGQGFPPVDLTTFVVAGIVAAQLGKKVDPLKSMYYSFPMCICMAIVGFVFLYM